MSRTTVKVWRSARRLTANRILLTNPDPGPRWAGGGNDSTVRERLTRNLALRWSKPATDTRQAPVQPLAPPRNLIAPTCYAPVLPPVSETT